MVKMLKEHTHYKRRQLKEIRCITDSLNMEDILIDLDFGKNYKSKHKNEVQCANFSTHARIIKMVNCHSQLPPRRVMSPERVKSLSCANKVISHSLEKLNQQIKTICIL